MKFISKWIQLKNIIVNEVTQTQKNKCLTSFPFCGRKKARNLLGVSASPGITPETRKLKGNHGAGREHDLETVIIRQECCEREMGKKWGGGKKATTERKREKG